MNGAAGSVLLYPRIGHEFGWHGSKPRSCPGQQALAPHAYRMPVIAAITSSEKGVRLAQKMQVGPCIPEGLQLKG